MDNKVFIIHCSAIIQNGLAEILHHNFNCEISLFSSLHDFINSNIKPSNNCLFFIEDKITSDELFTSYASKNNIVVFNIADNFSDSNDKDCIWLYDSTGNIIKKAKAGFDRITNNYNEGLTKREIDVLKLVALGYANKEIADKLFISTHTVISHRKNITDKLGIKSASGLTVYAVINNYLDTSNINISDLL